MSEEPQDPPKEPESSGVPLGTTDTLDIKVSGLPEEPSTDPAVMKRLTDQEAEILALKQKNDDQARVAIEKDLKTIGLDTEKYKDFSTEQLEAMRTAMVDSDRFQPLDEEEKPDTGATKNPGYHDSSLNDGKGGWVVPEE